MALRDLDRKLLWSRSGNQCAMPDCHASLTEDLGEGASRQLANAGVIVGEEAHIRSRSVNGPRYDPNYPVDRLDAYVNLILLCPRHHTLADAENGAAFTAEALEEIREHHEASVRDKIGSANQRAQELMAASLQEWSDLIALDEMTDQLASMTQSYASIAVSYLDRMRATHSWLLRRDWPDALPSIKRAFERHVESLGALLWFDSTSMTTLDAHPGRRTLDREHKSLNVWDPQLYNQLLGQYYAREYSAYWLARDLVRSSNYIIRAIRDDFDEHFRYAQGYVLFSSSDGLYFFTSREMYAASVMRGEASPPSIDGTLEFIAEKFNVDFPQGVQLSIQDLP